MQIIKYGDPTRTKLLVYFTCPECGAEFVAGPQECYMMGNTLMIEYQTHCPCCYSKCTGRPGKE